MSTVPVQEPTPSGGVLHPRALTFTRPAHHIEHRIGLLFASTGLTLVLLDGILGLLVRMDQGQIISLSNGWFYRILTMHGQGMILGVMLATMGAMWYVLHAVAPMRPPRMMATYGLSLLGGLCILVATLVGGFGPGWTFLPPLPFYPSSQWSVWSEAVFFAGELSVGAGFFIFCFDMLHQCAHRYGGLLGALGWTYLRGKTAEAPPPQVIAGVVVAINGLVTAAVGSTILTGLLGRTYDRAVGMNALVAKNLVYFFGHQVANLTIYLAAGMLYVVIPRYAGRDYHTSKPFIVGWWGSLIFILFAYSHHLYMDFVQPQWAQVISETVSYGALIPVAVITIYSMTMLVWGSRYRWTLASTLSYLGLVGWAVGGIGAVIDSMIVFNFRFHNTAWVIAHFHTYLALGVVLFSFAFLAHILERDTGRTSSRRARALILPLLLIGGYGWIGTWFLEGVLGVPRRLALQPPGTVGYSFVGSIFALIFALGFLFLTIELLRLGRLSWVHHRSGPVSEAEPPYRDGYAGVGHAAVASTADERTDGGPTAIRASVARNVPLATPTQLAIGVAATVVGLAAFFPQVVDASEVSTTYHHLDHAGDFFFGVMLALVIGSLPRISRWLGDRESIGLGVVIVAPMLMMLVMVPGVYEPVENHPVLHAVFHLEMAAFGFLTGLGATRLGRVSGRIAAILTVGMPVMFAAAMTTGLT